MVARGGQQFVQHLLVLAAQRAAEARQRLLFLKEGLGDGREGTTHGGLLFVIGTRSLGHQEPGKRLGPMFKCLGV